MLLFLFVAFPISTGRATTPVRLIVVEGIREFPEATEPGAIRYACAPERSTLAAFFAQRKVPFESELIHRRKDLGFCHIHYEPSLPGFRALPETGSVSHLFSSINALSFIARRKPIGDSLDILKAVLAQLPRPVDTTISVNDEFDSKYWPQATRFHFPDTEHHLTLRHSAVSVAHAWGQDYVKAGQLNGESRVLIPRRLFESRSADGETFRPLLETLKEGPYVRSKLSWEGGDLQFAADPKNPARLILFCGGAARDYWGAMLKPREYEYVLRVEFGADQAINLSQVGFHTDFLVSFLPAEKTVLVAEPQHENYGIAKAAANEVIRLYAPSAPRELHLLAAYFDDPQANLLLDPGRPTRLLQWLRQALPQVPPPEDASLNAALNAHVQEYCRDEPKACFETEGRRTMLQVNPDLLRRRTEMAFDLVLRATLTPRLLGLIESQLPDTPQWKGDQLDAIARRLRALGFRIIRVPQLVAPEMAGEWAGISYVNAFVHDRALFVPAFGLGAAEDRIFADLQRKLGPKYNVVPIYARFNLVHNGGVHCVFGMIPESAQ